jgi:TonB family protein
MGSTMSATLLDGIFAGRVIDGRFPLLEELGRTEWTSAWLTELDNGRGHKAAIKIFPVETSDARATAARWNVARTLSHPHLMPLFDAGRCEIDGEDLLFVVTEYADETLSQVLPERPLSAKEAREMLDAVLHALAYLHQLGLTHGHLRPTNIMVVDGQLKLSPDFGWCSRPRSYDPPEAGSGNVTSAADIWSLGILLVEALTQEPPGWDGAQGGEPEIPATIPEPFFSICRECLHIHPERRCTLREIREHLNSIEAMGVATQSAEPVVNHVEGWSIRRRAMITGAGLLVLVFLVGAFKLGWDLTPSPPAYAPQVAVSAPSPRATPDPETSAASTPAAETTPAPVAADEASQSSDIIKGSVVRQVMPDIPENILSGVQGRIRVEVRVEVDAKGNVSQTFVDTPGPSRYFANQALSAAQNWKFAPAKDGGRAVESTWSLQFQFDHSQSAASAAEDSP